MKLKKIKIVNLIIFEMVLNFIIKKIFNSLNLIIEYTILAMSYMIMELSSSLGETL